MDSSGIYIEFFKLWPTGLAKVVNNRRRASAVYGLSRIHLFFFNKQPPFETLQIYADIKWITMMNTIYAPVKRERSNLYINYTTPLRKYQNSCMGHSSKIVPLLSFE